MRLRLVAIAALASAATVALQAPAATSIGGATATEAPPAPSDAPAAEETQPQGPTQYAVGETIEVSGDSISAAVKIRVAEIEEAKSYGDYSKPAKGNVYLAAKYEYEALEDGATYGQV